MQVLAGPGYKAPIPATNRLNCCAPVVLLQAQYNLQGQLSCAVVHARLIGQQPVLGRHAEHVHSQAQQLRQWRSTAPRSSPGLRGCERHVQDRKVASDAVPLAKDPTPTSLLLMRQHVLGLVLQPSTGGHVRSRSRAIQQGR